mmetsp:Transcript_4171/g.12317  ORF Transcript_4171/g.12317 Transcript_4171/m.12317 type:complete len:291 (+) Transcript_4171:1044-1916(+)
MPGRYGLPCFTGEVDLEVQCPVLALLPSVCRRRHINHGSGERNVGGCWVVHVLVVVTDDLPARRHHEPLGHAVRRKQVRGDGIGAGGGTLPRQGSHLRTRDGDKVIRARRVHGLHLVVALVVEELVEGDQSHQPVFEDGGHLEHISRMLPLVEVIVGMPQCLGRALDARGVPSHHEEGCPSIATARSVKLHLGGACVDHGSRPDRHDGCLWIQHTLINDGLVLLDTDVQRHVVILGPTTKWGEPEQGTLESLLPHLLQAGLHEIGMPCVRRIPRLERVNHIRTLGLELLE